MDHKEKLRVARNLLSKEERKNHVAPFNGKAWTEQKQAIQDRVKREIKVA